jgi:hypothetical protein
LLVPTRTRSIERFASPSRSSSRAKLPRGSPSFGFPTEPQFAEERASVFPDPWLVRVPEEEDVALGDLGDPFERAGGPVFEQVLVHLGRRAVDEADALPASWKRRSKGPLPLRPAEPLYRFLRRRPTATASIGLSRLSNARLTSSS